MDYNKADMETGWADELISLVANLAQEANGNEVDFGMLPISEEAAYKLMAAQVIESLHDADKLVLLSTITAMNVSDFVRVLKASNESIS